MLPIIGAVVGFLGSVVPQAMKLYQDKKDKEHELKLLDLQMKAQAQGFTQRLEEINVQADVEESKALYKHAEVTLSGVKWVDAALTFLTSSVRPIITYSFFGLYAWVKIAMYQREGDIVKIWTEYDLALFSTIIAFWFGSRSMQRFFKK
ncbi:MAG: hypothetical protein DDT23_01120 [candidate division WS2 bacterium]|nr:hypothetical protein [Candidatus Lithacetigena glycinireducens]